MNRLLDLMKRGKHMSENKRFYWLKLKEEFFEDDTIQFIEEQENGKDYCLFYLKLCLKSLKTQGRLFRLIGENIIPYEPKSLAKITNTDVDTVMMALKLFQEIGLVKITNAKEIYMTQIEEMIGTETDRAQKMRELRAREKLEGNNVTPVLPNRYPDVTQMLPDIDKEIDIDRDIEKKESKEKKHLDNQWTSSGIPTVNQWSTEDRIDKDSTVQESIDNKSSSQRFIVPSVEEIQAYCDERHNGIDAQNFYDFYASKGWMIGKNKMKDWKACVRTWERNRSLSRQTAQDVLGVSGDSSEYMEDLRKQMNGEDDGDAIYF